VGWLATAEHSHCAVMRVSDVVHLKLLFNGYLTALALALCELRVKGYGIPLQVATVHASTRKNNNQKVVESWHILNYVCMLVQVKLHQYYRVLRKSYLCT
jgi:hypothetical protein